MTITVFSVLQTEKCKCFALLLNLLLKQRLFPMQIELSKSTYPGMHCVYHKAAVTWMQCYCKTMRLPSHRWGWNEIEGWAFSLLLSYERRVTLINIAHFLPRIVDNLVRKCKINTCLSYVYSSNFKYKEQLRNARKKNPSPLAEIEPTTLGGWLPNFASSKQSKFYKGL